MVENGLHRWDGSGPSRSPRRKRMNEMSRGAVVGFAAGLIFTFGLVAGGLFAAAAYVDEHPPRSVPGTVLFLLAAGVAIGAAASPFVVVVMRQARRRRIDQSAEEFESID